MNVKVVKKFRDKYSGETYEAGQVIELDENRFKEIQAVGNLLELIEEVKQPKKTNKSKEKE